MKKNPFIFPLCYFCCFIILFSTSVLAYGPFSLPISDTSQKITTGWHYTGYYNAEGAIVYSFDTSPVCFTPTMDTDSDGVDDNTDACSETPTNDDVDDTGCSHSQIDTDGDGIPDSEEWDIDDDGLSNGDEIYLYGTDAYDADTDDDDLQDGWEVNGYDADGDGIINVDLPAYGANPLKKDLFVEVDWMRSTGFGGHNHMLKTAAATQIVNTFAAMSTISNPDGTTGVAVHFDTGSLSGGNQLTSHDDDLNPVWREFETLKSTNFDSNRNGIFKYLIMGHKYNGACTNNGISRTSATDIVIALGCSTTQAGTINEQSQAITRQLRNAVTEW